MKKEIHPENYRPVAFKDLSNGDTFVTRSTVNTKDTIEIDGETLPLVKLEISSTSHPFLQESLRWLILQVVLISSLTVTETETRNNFLQSA